MWVFIPEGFLAISPGSRSAPAVAVPWDNVDPEGGRSAQGCDRLRGGTVVTGKIEQGIVRAGDSIEILGLSTATAVDVITQVESFGEVLQVGHAGDNVGCLLRKTAHDQVTKGQVLAANGSLTPRREFEAEVYVLKKEEGGRHTPFFDGYAPQFFFRTTNVTGRATVLGGVQMAMPGEGVQLKVSLMQPVAISDGDRFAVREGGKTVGSGVVTKVTA